MKDRIDICEKHLIIREALKKFACEVLGRAPKTAKDYTESMERYLPRFMESNMGIVISSIYDILDLNQLQNIYDRIRNNREWMSYNTHAHASTFTSGLKCYMQFIQSDYYPVKEKSPKSFDNIVGDGLATEAFSLHTEGSAFVNHCNGYERNHRPYRERED